MALNFTVSYSFSPNTTISSSQINTNFTDNAGVWQGLEALTKSLAALKVDADPSTALEVATKQYVDHYSTWRRPVLKYGSATTVSVESGLDGTSGNIPILFPDGSVRTETSTTRTTFDITRNATLTTSGAQSGLRATLSEATNTWYALYAVKVTDSSTQWCTVGDTVLPLQANYTTLNSNFGTSGWVYLGLIRNGDNSAATGDILDFVQHGNLTRFRSIATGQSANCNGILEASTASGSSVTWTYAAGTGNTNVPGNVLMGYVIGSTNSANESRLRNSSTSYDHWRMNGAAGFTAPATLIYFNSDNLTLTSGAGAKDDIFMAGFVDSALGVGSNPLL